MRTETSVLLRQRTVLL